ncbi:MAG TPA: hypothetical protein VK066_00050 [Chloroflexota bacterium]|nr:hypothetical protein [Chloroflexota bacterium]
MDSFNVMPIVFGGLAVLFGIGVWRNVLRTVRHPGRETSPPIPAIAAAPAPSPPAPTPHDERSLVDRALGLVVLGLLFVSRARARRAETLTLKPRLTIYPAPAE